MERFHVDTPILSASLHMTRIPDDELAVAMMSAFNDVLLEQYLDADEAFRGLAVVAAQDPQAAAAEIDRVGDESQIGGIVLAPTGASPPLGDGAYDVMYDAAQDHGLTIAHHASAGAFPLEFPRQFSGLKRFVSVHSLSHVWSHMLTIMSLLEHGTPEKFPDLNFVFLEGDIGGLPSMMFRLNKEYAIRRGELPFLRKQPEAYIREFYFSSQPPGEAIDPADMGKVLDVIGATKTLMFSSDFPHWAFDSPDELARHFQARFEPADSDRVLSRNAIEAFGLD